MIYTEIKRHPFIRLFVFTGVHCVPGTARCAETLKTWSLASRGPVTGLHPCAPAAVYGLVCSTNSGVAGKAETEDDVLHRVPVSIQPSSSLS